MSAVQTVSRGKAKQTMLPSVFLPTPSHPIRVKGQGATDIPRSYACDSNPNYADGHYSHDIKVGVAARVILINAIREHYHQFKDLQNAETRLTLQIKALCRRACGEQVKEDDDDEEGKAAKTKADKVYAEVIASIKDGAEEELSAEAQVVSQVAIPLLAARASIHRASLGPKGEGEKLCKQLAHVVPFVESIKGFSYGGLSMIIGEAGDLSNYANPGKLWKRMGLAPFTKGDQVKCGKTWRTGGGLTSDDWTAFGYSPRRRSVMFQIADSMMKHQIRADKDEDGNKLETSSATGYYGEVYLARKQYLIERNKGEGLTVRPAGKINKKNESTSVSLGKIHHQAKQFTEKRLLLKLWKAWNVPTP